jgi:hypothetical protein
MLSAIIMQMYRPQRCWIRDGQSTAMLWLSFAKEKHPGAQPCMHLEAAACMSLLAVVCTPPSHKPSDCNALEIIKQLGTTVVHQVGNAYRLVHADSFHSGMRIYRT